MRGDLMAKGRITKKRNVDFSHEEFLKKIKANEKTFYNRFNRFIHMYGLDKESFKKNYETKDNYYWAIEWTELMVALFKTFNKNPFFRERRNLKTISASEVIEYNEKLLNAIENELPEHIKTIIMTKPSYMSTFKLADKLPLLIDKVGKLVTALIMIGNQQQGDLFDFLNSQLDQWIYNLYRNSYNIKLVLASNRTSYKELIQDFKETEDGKESKELIDLWLSQLDSYSLDEIRNLDIEMVEELEKLMKYTMHLNYKIENDVIDNLKHYGKILGIEIDENKTEFTKEELEQQRLIYYMFLENKEWIPKIKKKEIEAEFENYLRERGRRKSIVDKIKEKQSKLKTMTKEDLEKIHKEKIEREKERLKIQIEACKERLHELEEDINCDKELIALEDKIEKDYLKFYKKLSDESEKYNLATNNFIGQLMLPFLLKGRKL